MASRAQFQSVFQSLVEELREELAQRGLPDNHNDRFQQCLISNTQGGKLNRGLTVVDTGLSLLQRPLSDDEFHHLSILGWATEIFQASYLVWDDIMDSSDYRRGSPCWYRQEGVGLTAVNDAAMLHSSIFRILRKHFRTHPAYCDLLELLQEASFRTELGQLCDTHVRGMNDMTSEMYSSIAVNKTAFYSFYLPVALALHYLQRAREVNLKQAERILLVMGEYFQIQDDYLDVFGDPEVTGKVGTDIQDNKCTWIIVQALQRCTDDQRQVLLSSYGQKGDTHEARVKRVFGQIDMEKVYRQFEDTKINELQAEIGRIDEGMGMRKEVFTMLLSKIMHRNK